MAQAWYQSAVLYGLDVRTFADGNGDGVGDFTGLAQRVEYLAGLGVDAVWLQPFYPTAPGGDCDSDDGSDVGGVMDHYAVDPALGTLGDFVEFVQQARERGLRVVVDPGLSGTSVQHPWYQAARRDRRSPMREWYLWCDDPLPEAGAPPLAWRWDEVAQSHCLHRGPGQQAVLNAAHPAVQRELEKITAFWLALGVSGFGVEALPWPPARPGPPHPGRRQAFEPLRALRRHVQMLRGDACLLAELHAAPWALADGFGDGDLAQLGFNAALQQQLLLALARGDARPLRRAWEAQPPAPAGCAWVHGLRGHDGLDLSLLTEEERQEVLAAFGPEAAMQVHGRALRRRLAPMLGNDARRLAQAHSLLLTLPGTPVLRYGDEIGMGEDLALAGCDSVRTPMQWSDAANGGFSSAPAHRLALPVVDAGEFGCGSVNVQAQRADPESLLHRLERMLRVRRQCPAFGPGRCTFLDLGAPALLALRCEHEGQAFYALHNLGAQPLELALPPDAAGAALWDLLAAQALAPHCDGSCWLSLEPYGYRWLRREPC